MTELSPTERKHQIGLSVWLVIAILPNILFQCLRLLQTTAFGWILCDYAGRLCTLLVLGLIPVTRCIAYRKESRRVSVIEIAAWTIVFVCVYPFFTFFFYPIACTYIPGTRLQNYILPTGFLRLFDFTVGLTLVAYHEEVYFRRCLWEVVSRYSNGFLGLVFCAAVFSLFHWTTGLPNMGSVFFFGLYAILFYRRCGVLWPIVLSHFLVDFGLFTGIT